MKKKKFVEQIQLDEIQWYPGLTDYHVLNLHITDSSMKTKQRHELVLGGTYKNA